MLLLLLVVTFFDLVYKLRTLLFLPVLVPLPGDVPLDRRELFDTLVGEPVAPGCVA